MTAFDSNEQKYIKAKQTYLNTVNIDKVNLLYFTDVQLGKNVCIFKNAITIRCNKTSSYIKK